MWTSWGRGCYSADHAYLSVSLNTPDKRMQIKHLAQCPAHNVCVLGWVQPSVTTCTIALRAALFIGFSRQEHRSELPFPPPAGLPDPGIDPVSPGLEGGFFTSEPPGKPPVHSSHSVKGSGVHLSWPHLGMS